MRDTGSQRSIGAIGPGRLGEHTSIDDLFMLLERPPWMKDAACREHDLDLFFPGQGADVTAAKRVCAGCLVRVECDQFAEEHDERRHRHGIWGGRSALQRDRGRPFVAPPPITEPPPQVWELPTPAEACSGHPERSEPEPPPLVAPAPTAAEDPPARPKRKRLPRHGTQKRWRRGCRCELCTTANREWWAAYRRRRKVA